MCRIVKAVVAVCVSLFSLAGCGIWGRDYTIDVSIHPTEAGTVEPGGGVHRAGELVILTATPSSGFEFDSWEDDSTENPRSIYVLSDLSVIAYFAEIEVEEAGESPDDEIDAAPQVPGNLSVGDPTPTSLHVSWDESANAENYQLFRNTDPLASYDLMIYDGTETEYTDTGLDEYTDHYYKVQATNDHGSSDLSSAQSDATEKDLDPPAVPEGLSVSNATTSSLEISWDAVDGAKEYTLQEYKSLLGYWAIYSGTETSYVDEGKSMGRTYSYRVRADKTYVSSDYSTSVAGATLGPPGPPSSVWTSEPSLHCLTVSWAECSDADGYRVRRLRPYHDPWEQYPLLFSDVVYEGSETTFVDDGIEGDMTHYYWVSAYNQYGDGAYSDYCSGTTLAGEVALSFLYGTQQRSYTDAHVTQWVNDELDYAIIQGSAMNLATGRYDSQVSIGFPGNWLNPPWAFLHYGFDSPMTGSDICDLTFSEYGSIGERLVGSFSATMEDGTVVTDGYISILREE